MKIDPVMECKITEQKLKTVISHSRVLWTTPATYAMQLVNIFAHSQLPDGEDSAGRQKYRPYTSQEAVAQAMEITELAFDEMFKRNWVLDAPGLDQILEDEVRPVGFGNGMQTTAVLPPEG